MTDAARKLMGTDTKTHCGCKARGVVIDSFGKLVRKRFHRKECKYARKA